MKKLIMPVAALAILFTACKKDDHDDIHPHTTGGHNHEEEVITTLIASFTDLGGGKTHTFKFSDPDGPGGNNGVITTDTLPANTSFKVNIEVLNESKTPTDTITKEILEEGKEHQFFYSSNNLDVTYFDKDSSNNPIGLCVNALTKSTGMDTLKITLRHEPNKSAAGVSNGDITYAGGETDIEVNFPYVIK